MTHKDDPIRDQAAEELKRTLAFLSATLEATTDGILGVDRDGKITSFNQKFVEMWNIPNEIVASKDDDKAIAHVLGQLKDPEGFLKKVKELYAQPDAESHDLLEFKDGKIFERFSQPQRIAGESVGRVWSFRDITEWKKAEENLKDSQEQIRLLLDSTAEAIFGLDLQGRCTFYNRACLRLFGLTTADELIGKDLHAMIHHTRPDGKPYPLQECEIYRTAHSGEDAHADGIFWRADGSSFPAEYWSYPIRKNGVLIGSVATFLDITERKQARDALESQVRTLEAFVYTVSHDLKSPVVSIHGMASILRETHAQELSDQAKHYVDRIIFGADHMEKLILDLLELSRIGQKQPVEQKVEVEAVIREILNIHKEYLQTRRVQVIVESPFPRFLLEHTWSAQLFQNLIINAAKFMGSQPNPRVEIGGKIMGTGVEFFVKDNGIGIDPIYHEKIFNIFHRLKEVEVEGTGVGMAIVKKIVDLNRGKIRIDSQKGKGSTFFIWLPQTDLSRKYSPVQ